MKLKLVAKPDGGASLPVAFVALREGRLQVECDDRGYADELAMMLQGFFVQGRGFPSFERDNAGKFVTDSKTGKVKLVTFVGLDSEQAQVLRAVRENFELGEQYLVSEVDDGARRS